MRKKVQKILALVIAVVAVFGAFVISGAVAEDTRTQVRVASLKGPTTMGMVKLMKDAEGDGLKNDYDFMLAGTADEIVPQIARGEIDIALVPANLASILYSNTDGQVTVAAINTLGVLYVVETGESISSIDDLAGMTIYSTGKGTTPEFALNYILSQNGIDPESDITIEYKSESTEVAAALAAGTISAAVLPQPYVTAVMAQNENLRVALSLTEEWDKVGEGSALVTGVVLVRNQFIEENPDAFAEFMENYAVSTEYVNENPAEAGEWIAELGIVANAGLAEKAIPACNIVCITGEEMRGKLSGYLGELYKQNPTSVGGELPDDAFYYAG